MSSGKAYPIPRIGYLLFRYRELLLSPVISFQTCNLLTLNTIYF